MRCLVIVSRDDHGVAHDGSAGVSPEGWLPDRVSVGALTRAFPPELVDRVVATTDTRELRRRLLPARLVVYFVLALWLFRGPNCGYGRVMVKLVDALYHRRRGQQLLEGVLDPDGWVEAGTGRRWRPPNISSCRGRGPGWGPTRCTCCSSRSPARSAPRTRPGCSAAGCGWCRWTAPPPTCPTRQENDEYFGRPVECHPGWGVPAGPVAGRRRVGHRGAGRGHDRPLHRRRADPGPGPAAGVRRGDARAGRPQLSVPHPGPRRAGHRGAHPVAGLGVVPADPHRGAGRRQLPGPAAPAA